MAAARAWRQKITSGFRHCYRTGKTAVTSSWQTVKLWCKQRSVPLITLGLVTGLLILFLWPWIFVTIHSGEAGVLYSRLFGGTVMSKIYDEGLHVILPWDIMYIYNTRLQEDPIDIQVLSRGGLSVNMKVSVFYLPIYDRLPVLHKEIGPDFREKLILPIVASSVRNTVGNYWPEDLYTSAPLKLQDEIMVQVVEQMARKPLIIDSLVVRRILLPAQVNNSIDLKFTAEQEYLRYKFVLLKAREELKRRYIEAESVRLFQETVNKGLTENFLRWSGIEATKELAASSNTKFVIIGSRDGLPVILNTEALSGKASDATPKPSAQPARPGEPVPESAPPGRGTAQGIVRPEAPLINWEAFTDRFKALENSLQRLDKSMKSAPAQTDTDKNP